MARYDWEALKREFLLGDYKSVREFARRKGLKYNAYFTKRTKGWAEEKEATRRQKEGKIIEGVIERQIEQEIDWNARHLEAWGKFLEIIFEAVKECHRHFFSEKTGRLNPYALEKAANVLKMAQEGQRKALGLDEKQQEQLNEIADKLREIVGALNDDNVQSETERVCEEGEEET